MSQKSTHLPTLRKLHLQTSSSFQQSIENKGVTASNYNTEDIVPAHNLMNSVAIYLIGMLRCLTLNFQNFNWRQLFSLHKKWSFPLRISSVNVTKSAFFCRFPAFPAFSAVTFTEEILNGKLHFLCNSFQEFWKHLNLKKLEILKAQHFTLSFDIAVHVLAHLSEQHSMKMFFAFDWKV